MSISKKIFNILAILWLVASMLLGYGAISTSTAKPAKAADAAGWNAGRIIDDGKFTNVNSMTESQIYFFMVGKVPNCDTNHPSGISGESPPWTCLKDYWEGGTSSAHIIWQAAQDYGINPQVLLVTLQKENGLVTDTWPYKWQYRTAMGFACPDNGSCDPAYYGFTNQVRQGARHLRNFFDNNPNWYVPYTTGTHFVQYNPNSGCGGSNVNIQTRGTAALYSYTPYQPNGAALANLYGAGDGCSAYGNRNFWRTFVDWFGSPYDPLWQSQFVSETYSKWSGNIRAGDRIAWTVKLRNTGANTWTNSGPNPVRLVSQNATSQLYAPDWISPRGSTTLTEASVAPGEVGTFTSTLQVPNAVGNYSEQFYLIAEGAAWFGEQNPKVNMRIDKGVFSGQVLSNTVTPGYSPGGTADVTVKVRNLGNVAWYNDGTSRLLLGTYEPAARASSLKDSTWLSQVVPATLSESIVAPGQTGTLTYKLKVPTQAGLYTEAFSLLVDRIQWFDQPIYNTLSVGGGGVGSAPYKWELDSQTFDQDELNTVSTQRITWTVKARNIGSTTWTNSGPNPIRLVSQNNTSVFQGPGWLSARGAASLSETTVAPGQVGTFVSTIQMPLATAGYALEKFSLVAENITWFNDSGLVVYAGVAAPTFTGQVTSDNTPAQMTPNSTANVTIKIKNQGNVSWYKDDPYPALLGTYNPPGRNSNFYDPSWFTTKVPAKMTESKVDPGQTATYSFVVKAPAQAGTYSEDFSMLVDRLRWFDQPITHTIQVQ